MGKPLLHTSISACLIDGRGGNCINVTDMTCSSYKEVILYSFFCMGDYTYRIGHVTEEDMHPYILRRCSFTRSRHSRGIKPYPRRIFWMHILRGGVV